MFKGIIQPCSLFTKKNLSSFTNTWNTKQDFKESLRSSFVVNIIILKYIYQGSILTFFMSTLKN